MPDFLFRRTLNILARLVLKEDQVLHTRVKRGKKYRRRKSSLRRDTAVESSTRKKIYIHKNELSLNCST